MSGSSLANDRLRVLIVSQYFRPERVSIPVTLADELARRGHRVEVVTGWPNYPEGELFPGYRQRIRHTERQGDVLVRRVPLVVSHSTSAVGRLLNYASFAVTSALQVRAARRADVVYVYATQMTASIGPSLWRRLFGTPYVLHVQDLWPESVTGSGMIGGRLSRFVARIMKPWLRDAYARAAHVIAIAPTMLSTLRARGASPARSSEVLNWSPSDVVDAADRQPTGIDEGRPGTTFVYAGNLGELQDLTTVVDAFALLSDLPGVELLIAGAGVLEDDLRDRAARHPDAHVTFLGRLDPAEMRALNARSDFQLVTLSALDIFRGTIPSKLQNAFANGIPVVTTVHGDVTALVDEHALGVTAPPADVAALADALRRASRTTPSQRAALATRTRRYYQQHMSEDAGVSAVEAVLDAAARTPRPTKSLRRTKNEKRA